MTGRHASFSDKVILLAILVLGGFAVDLTYRNLLPALPSSVTVPLHEIVSLVTDAAGNGQSHVIAEFKSVANMGHISVVATITMSDSFPANLQLKADLRVEGLQLSVPIPNVNQGQDVTIFAWDLPLPNPFPAPIPLKADVVLSVVSCGQCADLTLNLPVDLVVTMRA